MAADAPHRLAVPRLIEWAREQSIARRGAGNYAAMCANGHLSPGVEDSEIRKGLYPAPPNLFKPKDAGDPGRTDARRFWIVKHGLKASGR